MADRDLARLRPRRAWITFVLWALGFGLLTAVCTGPLSVQRTVESLRFDDLLGTVPVEVTLVRNGHSVLDTGVLGSVYWDRTGPLGLGAELRVTGPPNAGGTLASYVDPAFLRVNAQSVNDPAAVGPVKAMIRSLDRGAAMAELDRLLAAPPRNLRAALADFAARHDIAIG